MHSWLNYFNMYSKRFMGDDWGFRCYFNKNDVISHNVLDEKDCIQSFIFDKRHICDKHGAPFAAKQALQNKTKKNHELMEIADGAHKDERLSSYKINTVLIRWQPIWLLSEISEYINKLDNTLNGMGYLRITSRLFSKLVANFFQPPSHFSRISLLHKFFPLSHSDIEIPKCVSELSLLKLTRGEQISIILPLFRFFFLSSIENPFISNLQTATLFSSYGKQIIVIVMEKSKFFRLLDRHHFSQLRIRLLLS